MGWFEKKQKQKESIADYGFFIQRKRNKLFVNIEDLVTQAENYLHNGEIELCNDILNVAIKHIKKNKQNLGVLSENSNGDENDFPNFPTSESYPPKTPTRDTNTTLNEE